MNTTARMIDITAQEATTIGNLLDLLTDHINPYELTANELETLDSSEEILSRLYLLFNQF